MVIRAAIDRIFGDSCCLLFSCLFLPALLVLAMQGASVAQQTVGELYATDARVKGSVILAGSGTSVLSGSSIQAGAQAATLKLERGGSLLVCPGTKLSVTTSQSGRELMFSLNSGNLEMNYPIGAAADTLLTPDLRLLMPGPGTVHVAVHITAQGDTCVQSLPWNAVRDRCLRNHGRRDLPGEARRGCTLQGRTSERGGPLPAELRMSCLPADRSCQGCAATAGGVQASATACSACQAGAGCLLLTNTSSSKRPSSSMPTTPYRT